MGSDPGSEGTGQLEVKKSSSADEVAQVADAFAADDYKAMKLKFNNKTQSTPSDPATRDTVERSSAVVSAAGTWKDRLQCDDAIALETLDASQIKVIFLLRNQDHVFRDVFMSAVQSL